VGNSINDQLTWISDSISFLWPELMLISGMVLIIVASFMRRDQPTLYFFICLACVLADGLLLISGWSDKPVSLLNSVLRTDDFSATMRLLFAAGSLITLLMGWRKGTMEYFLMILSVNLGASLLVMTSNFIMILISMELISISSYVLTAGSEQVKERAEAAWKFFLFGSASTAVMIFGMSYLFGLTGTLDFSSTEFLRMASAGKSSLVYVGGILTLGGFLFKMSAVPFHVWAPDVYDSVPTPIAAFFSVVPKLAGLAIIIKFSLALHLFGQSSIDWALLVAGAAVISIVAGSVGALAQKDAKRMMAWSSIAQAGFLLAGVPTFSIEGVRVTLFYATVFLLMNFCTFLFIDALGKTGGSTRMDLLAGAGRRLVLPSILVTIALVSLTGLPPTGGFMAKLLLFSALWEKYTATHAGLFLAVLLAGVISTVISLFFYLRIPYFLFFKSSATDTSIRIDRMQNLLSVILVILLLLLFFNPGILMAWLNKVNFVL
jgi:NADH-quinone oxidoreductase subunit N